MYVQTQNIYARIYFNWLCVSVFAADNYLFNWNEARNVSTSVSLHSSYFILYTSSYTPMLFNLQSTVKMIFASHWVLFFDEQMPLHIAYMIISTRLVMTCPRIMMQLMESSSRQTRRDNRSKYRIQFALISSHESHSTMFGLQCVMCYCMYDLSESNSRMNAPNAMPHK